jgi:hypothetical protein
VPGTPVLVSNLSEHLLDRLLLSLVAVLYSRGDANCSLCGCSIAMLNHHKERLRLDLLWTVFSKPLLVSQPLK